MLGPFFRRSPRVRLSGPTVAIRPPRRRDMKQWLELRGASRTFLQPWEPTWSEGALTRKGYLGRLRRWQGDWEAGTACPFFIFLHDGTLVGGVTAYNIRTGVAQMASLGYWVGEAHARHGYMTEALLLNLDYCFRSLNLHRVEAACLPHNAASRALLAKCGFREEGFAREYLRIDGRWHDHVTHAILRKDPRPVIPIEGP